MKIRILVPTYNEAENITELIERINKVILNLDSEITLTVLDDNSPDGTARVVKKLIKSNRFNRLNLELLIDSEKRGLGKSYLRGFKNTIESNMTDYIIQMDADLSHDPTYIPLMIQLAKEGHDLIVGSRYIAGGGTPDWSVHRKLISRLGNLYSSVILGKIKDYTGGFNCFSVELLKKIPLDSIDIEGYGFLINLKYKISKLAKSSVEIPIVFHDRRKGNSKMPINTIILNLYLVLKIKICAI